ncbi:MAG: hypothetical protein Q8J68_14645 [Methanolobus sp.]|uniref:hypothetical protein n=1 Tax=Methanolobus sp. TaxID=1874737 RepID=UPI002731DD73|nr:hypothetical protein [Methanolobus sp.]MDP2218513.1 hypothetical protein [Methanolobus sp.]
MIDVSTKKKHWPIWTVTYNISSPNNAYTGKGWEFFDDENSAENCYRKQIARGNVPTTKRLFHQNDSQYMNLCNLDDPAMNAPVAEPYDYFELASRLVRAHVREV